MRHLTAFRADDASRNCRAQVVRAADGNDPLAKSQLVGVAERHHRKAGSLYLEDRDVRCRVRANNFRRISLVVVQCHFHLGSPVDNMIVGDDISVGTDDYT